MRSALHSQWRQLRGRIREHWAHLTDDALDWAYGQYGPLVGILQARHGHEMAVAEVRVSDFPGEVIDGIRQA